MKKMSISPFTEIANWLRQIFPAGFCPVCHSHGKPAPGCFRCGRIK
jgi:hypothetical protein